MGSCPGRILPPYNTKAVPLPLRPLVGDSGPTSIYFILFYFIIHLKIVFITYFIIIIFTYLLLFICYLVY